MAVTINDLINKVRTSIRDNGNVHAFEDLELEQFIQDGILEYSKYRPRVRPYTINLQTGVMTYDLPDDWIRADLNSLNKATQPTIPDPSAYALPYIYVSHPLGSQLQTMQFNWYDDDQMLVLSSAPIKDSTLQFDYYAFHTVDESQCTVPKLYQSKMLYLACAKALDALATDYSVKLQKYRVGGSYGIEVDDSSIAKKLSEEANKHRENFRKEIIMKAYGTSGGDDS